MKRILIAAAAVAVLAGCSSDSAADYKAQAEEVCLAAVADKMKDPDSAQFRNVTIDDGVDTERTYVHDDGTENEDVPSTYWTIEGEVNAKNGFGAMVGYREFKCQATKSEGYDMKSGYIDIADR